MVPDENTTIAKSSSSFGSFLSSDLSTVFFKLSYQPLSKYISSCSLNRHSKNSLVRITLGVESSKTERSSGNGYDTSRIKHAPPIHSCDFRI